MRVAANGNVGIGTTDPVFGKLQIEGVSQDGVHGHSTAKAGVHGHSINGSGVDGFSDNGTGVFGNGINEVSGWMSDPDGYALTAATDQASARAAYFGGKVYVQGNMDVTGTLTKPAGSFKIDHPLDPANKYLSHSFVESPDMKNIYDGTVTTDGEGAAVVQLPAYFEALNRDFRYQLTVIGQFAQAMVVQEIAGNRFSIRTDKPNVKVSWQVTGIRKDAYAEAHRIAVEEAKPASVQGKYLTPKAHGLPEALGIGVAQQQRAKVQAQAQAQGHR